jgi:Fur family peroxide stress response transcriptional regulator
MLLIFACFYAPKRSSGRENYRENDYANRNHRAPPPRSATDQHPTADEVFLAVRHDLPGISLATVYKSLETLVGCGLAVKLTYGDGSARYDGRTDPHHHARCLACGKVTDIEGSLPGPELYALRERADGFLVTGYRLELSGYCPSCAPRASISA